MSQVLSFLCALAVLVGALAFSRQGGDRVSFVEMGAAAPLAAASAARPA